MGQSERQVMSLRSNQIKLICDTKKTNTVKRPDSEIENNVSTGHRGSVSSLTSAINTKLWKQI